MDMHGKTGWRHRGDYGAGKISHKKRKSSSQGSGSLGDSTDGHRCDNGWGNGLHGDLMNGRGDRDGIGDGDSKTGARRYCMIDILFDYCFQYLLQQDSTASTMDDGDGGRGLHTDRY